MFITLCRYDNFRVLEDRSLYTTGSSDSDLILVQRLITHIKKKFKHQRDCYPYYSYGSIPVYNHTKNMHVTQCAQYTLIMHTFTSHTHPLKYVHIHMQAHTHAGTYCTCVLQETRVDEILSRELQLMQFFKSIFSVTTMFSATQKFLTL